MSSPRCTPGPLPNVAVVIPQKYDLKKGGIKKPYANEKGPAEPVPFVHGRRSARACSLGCHQFCPLVGRVVVLREHFRLDCLRPDDEPPPPIEAQNLIHLHVEDQLEEFIRKAVF